MRTSIRSLSNAPRFGAAMASVFVLGTLTASVERVARADETTVTSTPKGIIGGALLGAEVGTIIESIAGVRSPWVYVISDIVLAGGGAAVGWEVEQKSTDGRAPVFMLAGGLGLIIPAVVLTLNAVTTPVATASEDHAPTNEPPANPGAPGRSIVAPPTPAPGSSSSPNLVPNSPSATPGPTSATPPAPATTVHLSLVDVNKAGMHLGLPIPEVRPMFSASELRQYGLAQQTEVRMSLVKIAF
jgi:hypothetical protein